MQIFIRVSFDLNVNVMIYEDLYLRNTVVYRLINNSLEF